jgi:sugar phosphate isomerase/epimerase
MARPVTLFTGQWADLPLEELAPLAKDMGYGGLELPPQAVFAALRLCFFQLR